MTDCNGNLRTASECKNLDDCGRFRFDTGAHANGICEDGGPGSVSSGCQRGFDFTDCGLRDLTTGSDGCGDPNFTPQGGRNNGICEDGGPGSASSVCNYCDDFQDCGPRPSALCYPPSPPPTPPRPPLPTGCSSSGASSALDTGCDIWKTMGYVIIAAGAVIHTMLIVGFCLVNSKAKAAKARAPPHLRPLMQPVSRGTCSCDSNCRVVVLTPLTWLCCGRFCVRRCVRERCRSR